MNIEHLIFNSLSPPLLVLMDVVILALINLFQVVVILNTLILFIKNNFDLNSPLHLFIHLHNILGISCLFDKDFCNLEVTGMDNTFKFAIERGTNFDNMNDGPTLDHNQDPQECDV